MRFVGFGLLEQGLHFAPTCGHEAHHALPFVMCGVAALDPVGVLHAAHQLSRVTDAYICTVDLLKNRSNCFIAMLAAPLLDCDQSR
jgi:hypothetical protein